MKNCSLTIHVLSNVAVGLIAGCDSDRGSSVPKQPVIRLTPTNLDVGVLAIGDDAPVERELRISNFGTSTLKLKEMYSTCGCTLVGTPPPSIEPGQAALVLVQISRRNVPGPQSSLIYVESNDEVNPIVNTRITWIERGVISLAPEVLDLGYIEDDQSVDTHVDVTIPRELEWDSIDVRANTSDISHEWLEPRDTGGTDLGSRPTKTRALGVRIRGGTPGHPRATLRLQYEREVAVVAFSWTSGPMVSVVPRSIFESQVQSGGIKECKLSLRAAGDVELIISEIRVDGVSTRYEIDSTESEEGRSLTITVPVQLGKTPGMERHKIELRVGEQLPIILVDPVIFLTEADP